MKVTRRIITTQIGLLAGAAALSGSALAEALAATPRQTAGPFYPPKPHGETDIDLTMLDGHSERAAGDVIRVRGRVTGTDGKPLANARIDVWQANHFGRYAHPADRNPAPLDPNFQGIGIMQTDADGYYGFRTIMPAPYRLSPDEQSGFRPRHIHFKVSHANARELTTQMYFAGDPLIGDDVVMRGTPEELRHLLIASPTDDAETGLPLYRFDLALA